MEIQNKIVVITGGSKGIGKATAELFAAEGGKMVIIARNKKEIEKTVQKLKANGTETIGISADVSKLEEVKKAIEQVIKKFGQIDILINNAGVATWKNFLEQTPEEWNKEIDTNLKGVMNCCYAVVPTMVEQEDGVVINISSGAGKTGSAGLSPYCASKFAVLGFTEAFAKEVENKGIRVYAVCPGMTKTQMTNFQGIPTEKVARRILETAKETFNLSPGGNTEIYS